MWIYKISTGIMYRGPMLFQGYSGAGRTFEEGRNNPGMQNVVGHGPIPVGRYAIGVPHTSPNTGPYTMNLDPLPATDTLGRSAFRIHGDNSKNDASHGCVILGRTMREAVWNSGDHVLEVVE